MGILWCNLVVLFQTKQQFVIEFVKRSRKPKHMKTIYFDDFFVVEVSLLNTNIVLFLYHFQSLEERLKTTTFIYYWSINGEKRGATTFLRERTGRYSS